MNAAAADLLREFVSEARLRGRRTKCPHERKAAEYLERKFLRMLARAEAKTHHANTQRNDRT